MCCGCSNVRHGGFLHVVLQQETAVLGACPRCTTGCTINAEPDTQAACRKRLDETFAHMRERISGKLGNRNDNAFKLRKLFAMYDTQRTGKVAPGATSRMLKADVHMQHLAASLPLYSCDHWPVGVTPGFCLKCLYPHRQFPAQSRMVCNLLTAVTCMGNDT